MTRFTELIGAALLTLHATAHGQALEDAEVRLPYSELKRLLSQAEPAPTKPARLPALLSTRLKLAIEDGRPVIDASFRATGFPADEMAVLPLLANPFFPRLRSGHRLFQGPTDKSKGLAVIGAMR